MRYRKIFKPHNSTQKIEKTINILSLRISLFEQFYKNDYLIKLLIK